MSRITRACLDGEENAAERLTPLMINVGRFQFALNGLLVLGFALLGRHFIVLWMGAEYADAYVGILLVTAPGLFYNSLEVANTYMVVKNKVNIQAWIAIACGAVNVALSFVLSKFFGAVGACVSICVAYTLRAVLYHAVHGKILGFNIWEFIKKCYLRMLPAFAVTGVSGILLNCFWADAGWLVLFAKIICVSAVYCLSVAAFCLSKEERRFIWNKLHRRPSDVPAEEQKEENVK